MEAVEWAPDGVKCDQRHDDDCHGQAIVAVPRVNPRTVPWFWQHRTPAMLCAVHAEYVPEAKMFLVKRTRA